MFKRVLAVLLAYFVAFGSITATAQVPIYTKGPNFNPSSVGITGGSITGVSGVPYTLLKPGPDFISISSGSVAANGAITGITALPFAYPHAYCWFPANILAAAISAGWYYCTFSTTTAGTAFLNTYTSGTPTVPTSPTAVTAGQGAYTGDVTLLSGPQVTVPANAMGANGALRVTYDTQFTSNANGKFVQVVFGGTIFFQQNGASLPLAALMGLIKNSGATNDQFSDSLAEKGVTTAVNNILGTVDTTAAQTAIVKIQKATATDNAVVSTAMIEVIS